MKVWKGYMKRVGNYVFHRIRCDYAVKIDRVDKEGIRLVRHTDNLSFRIHPVMRKIPNGYRPGFVFDKGLSEREEALIRFELENIHCYIGDNFVILEYFLSHNFWIDVDKYRQTRGDFMVTEEYERINNEWVRTKVDVLRTGLVPQDC